MSKEVRKEKIEELCRKIKYETEFCDGILASLNFVKYSKFHGEQLRDSLKKINEYAKELEKYK